ncbi:aldehyde dehydrogenase, iron-sulfur subunit [Longilinea arvoryzae]|uniref:Aldehyde dehydrogenase, iron-sulfur subunit n=1 Tax=Longilinea arvoryzae TaxID=360412 RepID=A0A0S7B820_9CHLR|nr:pyridine nucleotide-disulfide oxidoreductase/dicluster-binding protein [Longilinea arvoryzae]GAP13644.1 aldehyde dehydrogenase, iron-sulfur subunit [Longilinea arvoryzae]
MDQNELHALESKCIQECIPTCAAACPMHVDVRAMCAEISQGNFGSAYQILNKTLPFPGIICRICDQPCRPVCKRDQAIAIVDLERACVDFGKTSLEIANPHSRRKQRIAVVGGGLSGLTAAYDLAKKRYAVTVFEANSVLGGRLRSIPESRLPRSIIESDFDVILKMGVEVRLNTPVSGNVSAGNVTLGQLQRDFDAVYLAIGSNSPARYALGLNDSGLGTIDPVTRATAQPGVFAGSDIDQPENSISSITTMSDGRIAAISIDRFAQRVSLTASRINEGAFESCLYTNTEGVPALPVTPRAGASFTSAEAIAEAKRCLKCECLECVKVCQYLSSYGAYPRKYARKIYNNLSIVMGTRLANTLINSCALCGQCAEVCPTNLDMGALCKQARQTMVEQGHMPPSAHDFALRDMQFSNSDQFAMARNQPGTSTSSYLFFPGCQLSASAPEQVEKIYAYLRDRLPSVGLMLRCCGTMADWSGRKDLFQEALADFSALHAQMGRPKVVLACSSCYQVFKNNLPDVEIVSLWELFDQYGLPEDAVQTKKGVVSIHDPCSTRHESQIHESVRRLVDRAGYRIEELPLNREKTSCCSYGGDMWLANRELAQKVVERRIAESDADYLTYCAMCRDFFAARGKPTLHLLDLLFEKDPQARATRQGPGYSQRHENRARLKWKMLKEIWGETMPDQASYESIQLIIPEDVQKVLEDRLILVEDLQRVIEYAEKTGQKFLNPATGRLLAHYKPTRVTYWVEYSRKGDAFRIHNAYSHRMELGEDVKP